MITAVPCHPIHQWYISLCLSHSMVHKHCVSGVLRSLEKARLDYGGQYDQLKDLLRATVYCNTLEEISRCTCSYILTYTLNDGS